MIDPRKAEGTYFDRRSACVNILSQIPSWEIWGCSDPSFSYKYEQDVTLHVNKGSATLAFSDGTSVTLQTGDVLTIRKGASAVWAIPAGIQNSYQLHSD